MKGEARRACEPRDQRGHLAAFDLVLVELRAAHRQRRLRRRQLVEQGVELQLAQQLAHRALVDARPIEIVHVRLDRRGGVDTDQLARQLGVGAMLRQQRGDSLRAAQPRDRFDLREVGVELVERAEMLDQRGRGFLADTGDALDVVDRIAHQRHHVDHRGRIDAEPRAHFARVDAPVAHRVPQRHVRPDQLHEVLVLGDDHGGEALECGARGQRADNVVSLEALEHQALDAKGLDRAQDVRNLHGQIVGRLDPVGFVGLEKVIAESFARRVEDHGDMPWALLLEQLEEHPDKAVDGVGGQPARIVELRQSEERAENIPRAVDQIECRPFFSHRRVKLSQAVVKAKPLVRIRCESNIDSLRQCRLTNRLLAGARLNLRELSVVKTR